MWPTRPTWRWIKGLDLPFVTVDRALRADGQWRVVEIGDGQVSDYPAGAPADALIAAVNADGAMRDRIGERPDHFGELDGRS